MVHFCGHRLHVHSTFKLFMTTPISPTLLSPSLASQVSVINFSSSIPLAEDILLDTIFDVATRKGTDFIETTRDLASCKAELVSLDEEMFSKLPVNGKDGCYWWSTEKIADIVSKKNGVCSLLYNVDAIYPYVALSPKRMEYAFYIKWILQTEIVIDSRQS